MFHVKQKPLLFFEWVCYTKEKTSEVCFLPKTVAIANQKGGVGKTTTAVNLSAGVGQLGKKVLLIDLDPQGNATSGYGVDKRQVENSSYDLLSGSASAENAVLHTEFKNVDLIPSSIDLAGAEIELSSVERRDSRLRQAIAPIVGNYDFVFIDCPPSLGLITINCLCAADTVLIPIQCEYYALEGLSQLISSVRQVKRLYNPTLEIEGILPTMYDGRLNLTHQVVSEVKNFFPGKVFKTAIPRGVRISEAPSFGQPIMYYDRSSKGAKAYCDLAKEFVKNNKNIDR